MNLEEYKSYEQKDLYDLSFNGVYVGLALEEKVMRKLVKLQCEYEKKIKEVLYNNLDNIHFQGWTLNSEQNKAKGYEQTSVRYTEKRYQSKEDFIKSFKLNNIEKRRYFIDVEGMDKATKLIDFELEYFNDRN